MGRRTCPSWGRPAPATARKRQSKIEVPAEITRLRRFCCHPRLVFPDADSESAKVQTFLELVEELRENQHRALVFSRYVDFPSLVREQLDERAITYGKREPNLLQRSGGARPPGCGPVRISCASLNGAAPTGHQPTTRQQMDGAEAPPRAPNGEARPVERPPLLTRVHPMKTSAIALAGLVLAAALSFSATGCKINHYGARGGAMEPGDQALCKATCDHMVEDQAIPSSALKACQSRCQPHDAAPPTKTVAVRVVDETCQSNEEACSRDTCGPRGDAPCQCNKQGSRPRARTRAEAPPPPPPECQVDWDCPRDMACDSGECK